MSPQWMGTATTGFIRSTASAAPAVGGWTACPGGSPTAATADGAAPLVVEAESAYRDLDAVIEAVNAGPRPLAVYPFSNRGERIDRVVERLLARGFTDLTVLDIVPTHYLYAHVTREFVESYFHWFLFLRPEGAVAKAFARVSEARRMLRERMGR